MSTNDLLHTICFMNFVICKIIVGNFCVGCDGGKVFYVYRKLLLLFFLLIAKVNNTKFKKVKCSYQVNSNFIS